MEIVNQTKVTITPEMATEMLANNTRNRPLSQVYVRFLSRQISEGNWMYNGQPIIFGQSGILLDGQHRLSACVKSGVAIIADIKVGVPDDSFATIDDRKGRSNKDVFFIKGINDAQDIAQLVSRYHILHQGNTVIVPGGGIPVRGKCALSRQESLSLYFKHSDVFDESKKLSRRCYKKRNIMSIAMIGAYSSFLIIDKHWPYSVVESFFYQLCGDNSECPKVTTLSKMLTDNAISHRKMSSTLFKAYITKAWNAYVTGDKRKFLSFHPETEQMPDFASNAVL